MSEAWEAYDLLLDDDRVAEYREPAGIGSAFRTLSALPSASPKVWADAWLLAFESGHDGQAVTFDQALKRSSDNCLLLV